MLLLLEKIPMMASWNLVDTAEPRSPQLEPGAVVLHYGANQVL